MISTSANPPDSSRGEGICFHFADEGLKARDGDPPGIVKQHVTVPGLQGWDPSALGDSWCL